VAINYLSTGVGLAKAYQSGGPGALLAAGAPMAMTAAGKKLGKSVFGGMSPAQAAMSAFSGKGATPFSQVISGATSKLGLKQVGMGQGTRPKALHTEHAKTTAEWEKPYGSGTDIVFYLQRADSAGGAGGSDAFSKEADIFNPSNDSMRGFDWEGNYGFMSESGYSASTYEALEIGSQNGAIWENSSVVSGDYFSGNVDWTPMTQAP
jgi:hypothetical protein